MTKYLILPLMALAACDLNEGPREESREAVEAIGERPSSDERVQREVEDIQPADAERESLERDLDRELKNVEDWARRTRQDVDAGTREFSEDVKAQLKEVEEDLRKLRSELDEVGNKSEAELREFSQDARQRMRELGDKIDRLDGEGTERPVENPR
jgi:DNA anti-recombination protein RmuC